MSASTGERIVAALVFLVVGFPAGLCSVVFTPSIIRDRLFTAFVWGDWRLLSILLPWLAGFVVAFLLCRWVVRAFRG